MALRFSIVIGILAGCPALAQPFTSYRIVATRLAGDNGTRWDHVSVDPARDHVFVGRGADGLMVLDAATAAPIATVADTKGSHGAAIAPDLGIGFSDDGPGGMVTVFDLASLEPRARFKAGDNTDGVFYDPATKQGFVNNGTAGTVTLFDAVTLKLAGTIDLDTKKPEFAAVDGAGRAYIDLQDKNSIAVIDLARKKVVAVWPVRNCEQPTSLWYEPKSLRLFVGCRGTKPALAVLDARTGATVADVPIGAGNDWVGFDSVNRLILLANGTAATLSVVRQNGPDDYALEETVGTRPLARTGAFDQRTGRLFLVTGQYARPAPTAAEGEMPNHVFPGSVEILVLERRAD
jgi:DNA-binding beta-propeller fold protein YncE